jgi:hypothetical protein
MMLVVPKGRRDAERDARAAKGTQRRGGRRGRRASVVHEKITLPLVVALVIALSFEAIRQLPSASVFDRQEGKDSELMHVVARSAKVSVSHQHHVHHSCGLENIGERGFSPFACC